MLENGRTTYEWPPADKAASERGLLISINYYAIITHPTTRLVMANNSDVTAVVRTDEAATLICVAIWRVSQYLTVRDVDATLTVPASTNCNESTTASSSSSEPPYGMSNNRQSLIMNCKRITWPCFDLTWIIKLLLFVLYCLYNGFGYWCIGPTCMFFCIYVSSFCILWVASIVDRRVFWQPGSVTIGVELPWLLFIWVK